MKNILLLTLLSVLLLSACSTQNTQTPSTNQPKSTSVNTNPKDTGGFYYYIKEAPKGNEKTALGKVCMEPAQLSTVNNGNMFCFTNTQAALDGLGIKADDSCEKYYWGGATIEFKNLTEDVATILKSDPCFEAGTCAFNTAEFVKAIEINFPAKCSK